MVDLDADWSIFSDIFRMDQSESSILNILPKMLVRVGETLRLVGPKSMKSDPQKGHLSD